MATYDKIQDWVKENYGFKPKSGWIAHVKEKCGLKPKVAPNRKNPNKREEPCPDDKTQIVLIHKHGKPFNIEIRFPMLSRYKVSLEIF